MQKLQEIKEEIVNRLEKRMSLSVSGQPEIVFVRAFQLEAEKLGLSNNFVNEYLQVRSFAIFEELFFNDSIGSEEVILIAELEAEFCRRVLKRFWQYNDSLTVKITEKTIARIICPS